MQVRTINRLLGFELIPVPQRHWRFGPDYRALRIIGGESGGQLLDTQIRPYLC